MSSMLYEGFSAKGEGAESRLPSKWGLAIKRYSFVKLYHAAPTKPGMDFIKRNGVSLGLPVKDVTQTITGYYLRAVETREHYSFLGGSPFYFGPKFQALKSPVGVLVEGVLDNLSVSLWFDQVVSIMSASLTSYQVEWVKVLFEKVLVITDADGPGKRGADKIMGVLSREGVYSRNWTLQAGRDPGDYFGDSSFGGRLIDLVGALKGL